MLDKQKLCEKIKSIYPEIGACGINVEIDFDEKKQAWIIDLKKGSHHLKTYLEPTDADACMQGKQCIYLGTQISQLVENIKKV